MNGKATQAAFPKLAAYKRIAIKIGSSLLVDREKGLKAEWLRSLADDVAQLIKGGHEILIISSGSIALGRGLLGLSAGKLKLEESQASAAIGQITLAREYCQVLAQHDIQTGQILLTLGDTEDRRRYLNARATIDTLLKLGAVPIINENDTVATTEIRYGDNDRLAARVATMMDCDLLVLLSDIDGLYSQPPTDNPDAEFIEVVPRITPEIEAMAGDVGTELSRGGMVTKIDAGKIATAAGVTMAITSGKKLHPITALGGGERATWFEISGTPISSRLKWISGQLEIKGKLSIDQGAINALGKGNSLLPAGVKSVTGDFERGDVIAIVDENENEVGRGISAYDSDAAERIKGRKSKEIGELLGYEGRSEIIHKDYLVLHKP